MGQCNSWTQSQEPFPPKMLLQFYFKAGDAQQEEDASTAGHGTFHDMGHATISLWLCHEIDLGHHRLPGPAAGRGEDEEGCRCQLRAARPSRSPGPCRQLHLGAMLKEAARCSSHHIACQTAAAAVQINPHKQTDA